MKHFIEPIWASFIILSNRMRLQSVWSWNFSVRQSIWIAYLGSPFSSPFKQPYAYFIVAVHGRWVTRKSMVSLKIQIYFCNLPVLRSRVRIPLSLVHRSPEFKSWFASGQLGVLRSVSFTCLSCLLGPTSLWAINTAEGEKRLCYFYCIYS